MKTEFLVIGGGVAGLSAALPLAERGCTVTLVEAGGFPAHKICGEFLSPECLPLLERRQISPGALIDRAVYTVGARTLAFDLPYTACGLSRYELDHALAVCAEKAGVRVLTQTRVETLRLPGETSHGGFEAVLSSGECLLGHRLIVSTGRIPGRRVHPDPPNMIYAGFKAHFRGFAADRTLRMVALPGAYAGLSNVTSDIVNVACLVRRDRLPEGDMGPEGVETFLQQPEAAPLVRLLAGGTPVFPEWMAAPAPEFGIRTPPAWPHTFFIGDAAGSIFPATGDGLGMAMTGGALAAEYAEADDAAGFREAWEKRYQKRFRWGQLLHRAMLSPGGARTAIGLCRILPGLPSWLFRRTREPPSDLPRRGIASPGSFS